MLRIVSSIFGVMRPAVLLRNSNVEKIVADFHVPVNGNPGYKF
jgi:hypothetical protein